MTGKRSTLHRTSRVPRFSEPTLIHSHYCPTSPTPLNFLETWRSFVKSLFAALALFALTTSLTAEDKTVTGWVLDSACAFTKGLSKPISRDCALACARKGSQLVILQNDGTIYWPISDQTPAEGQNQRLLPFAGKRVTVTGKLYTRGGSNALVIEKIADAAGQ